MQSDIEFRFLSKRMCFLVVVFRRTVPIYASCRDASKCVSRSDINIRVIRDIDSYFVPGQKHRLCVTFRLLEYDFHVQTHRFILTRSNQDRDIKCPHWKETASLTWLGVQRYQSLVLLSEQRGAKCIRFRVQTQDGRDGSSCATLCSLHIRKRAALVREGGPKANGW